MGGVWAAGGCLCAAEGDEDGRGFSVGLGAGVAWLVSRGDRLFKAVCSSLTCIIRWHLLTGVGAYLYIVLLESLHIATVKGEGASMDPIWLSILRFPHAFGIQRAKEV